MDTASSRNSKLNSRRARNRKVADAPPSNDRNGDVQERSPPRRRQRQKKNPTTNPPTTSTRSARKSPHDNTKKARKSSSPSSKRRQPPATCEKTVPLHERAKYVALDCEMVGVEDGTKSAVARVCLLNWDGDVLLDTYVRVEETVVDYRTDVSGVRREHLASDDAITFEDCRSLVVSLLGGKVLVGHGLKNDLRVLDISHPWHDVRDTAKYEPFMKKRSDDGKKLWPRKLKELAEEKLGQTIQQDGQEHCPNEDAKAALELYKTVRNKWEKVMEYKMKRTREIRLRNEAAGSTQRPELSQVLVPVQ